MAELVMTRKIWVFSDDLVMGSRIAACAQEEGLAFERMNRGAVQNLRGTGGILFVDLDVGLDRAEAVIRRALKSRPDAWHICGFGSHVDYEGLRMLKELGADRVVSRARLASSLRSIIRECLI